jgi:hypothetical protein
VTPAVDFPSLAVSSSRLARVQSGVAAGRTSCVKSLALTSSYKHCATGAHQPNTG